MNNFKKTGYTVLHATLKVFTLFLTGIIFLIIISYIISLFDKYESYIIASIITTADEMLRSFVSRYIPTVIKGIDMTRKLIFFGAVILKLIIYGVNENLAYMIESMKSDLVFMQKSKKNFWPFFKTKNENKSELKELLVLNSNVNQKLEKWARALCMLSVDVVHSTEMKLNEDESIAEYDFTEYKDFVERIITGNDCMKSTWTPDGVMACYSSFELAFKAAREIIEGLPEFNKTRKSIKADFSVRCGINAGKIYYDDALPLEELSNRAIDIAGHLQKKAGANTIYVTKKSIKPLASYSNLIPIDEDIYGQEIFEWRSKRNADETYSL
ncbi:MAG: hypothetical protein ABIH89_05750 [Elusimicrobiota bacterium]